MTRAKTTPTIQSQALGTIRRQGGRYCGSDCGRGCTWEEYQEALRQGAALLNQMKGTGWKLRLWENLGWHYDVRNGPANVHPIVGGFHAMISGDDSGVGGSALWTSSEVRVYRNPNRAVREAMKLAINFANHISGFVHETAIRIGVESYD